MIDTDHYGHVVAYCDTCDGAFWTDSTVVDHAVEMAWADGWDIDSNETAHCPECKEKK